MMAAQSHINTSRVDASPQLSQSDLSNLHQVSYQETKKSGLMKPPIGLPHDYNYDHLAPSVRHQPLALKHQLSHDNQMGPMSLQHMGSNSLRGGMGARHTDAIQVRTRGKNNNVQTRTGSQA